MKQRITPEDILGLNLCQRNALREFWQPEIYDVAVNMICTDVEADQYLALPFVVGGIEVESINAEKKYELRTMPVYAYDYCTVWLQNLGYHRNAEEEEIETNLDEDVFDEEDDDEDPEDEAEAEIEIDSVDYDLAEQAPYYNKEECLPLLSIGQMMAIIEKDRPQSGFRINRIYDSYICTLDGKEYEDEDLCDLLWGMVKELV